MKRFVLLFAVPLLMYATPAAAQWKWLNPMPEGNEFFAAHFKDAQTGWATGGNGAILKTTDGGETWASQTNPLRGTPFLGLSIVFSDAMTGVIAMNNGSLLRSDDGGYTWTLLPRRAFSFQKIRRAPDGVLWAVGSLGIIATSMDGGLTWTDMNSGTNTVVYDISFPETGTVVAVCGGGLILRSTDGGQQWTQIGAPLGTDIVSVDFPDPLLGYAVQLPKYLLRSTDGGLSWADTSFAVNELAQIEFVTGLRGWLVSNSPGSVYTTTNGGTSWDFVEVQRPRRVTIHGVHARDENNVLLFGTGGALFTSSDAGMNWVQRGDAVTRAHLYGITALSDTSAWVFGERCALFTNDAGMTWSGSDSIPLQGFRTGFALTESRLIGAGAQGQIMLSLNAGMNWSVQTLSTAAQIEEIVFVDALNGWLAGAHGTLARTTNGGEQWIELDAGVTHDFNGIAAISATTAWVVGNGGVIFHTTDGGVNWTEQSSPASMNLHAVAFTSPTDGWVGGQMTLLRTTDAGATWTEASGLIGLDVVYRIRFSDAQHGFFMLSRSVARTKDGGQTFYRTDYPAVGLEAMDVTANGFVWVAGRFGTIQHYTPTAAILIRPPILNFGDVAINKQRVLEFTVSNSGEVDMLFNNISTVGEGFLLAQGDMSPLPPGESRPISVAFAPIDTGQVYGLATIHSNAALGKPFIDLTGRGVPAGTSALTHTPDTLDFGRLLLGTFATRTVFITNRGTQALLINREVMTGGDSTMFVISRESSYFLAGGRLDSIQVTFSPLRAGVFRSRLLVESNDQVEPMYYIEVRGEAVTPVISADEQILDFGWVHVDNTETRDLIIRNIGGAPLHIFAWTPGGVDAALFTFTNPGVVTLQEAESLVLPISFRPTSLGPKFADLTISSDDLVNGNYVVQLRGNPTTSSVADANPIRSIALAQNYPNPVSPAQHEWVSYDVTLPDGVTAELLLYDMSGRLVRSVALQRSNADVRTVKLPIGGLQSGRYSAFLRVFSGTEVLLIEGSAMLVLQ